MTTYTSNKDGNSIMVDAQDWEELQALVKRQRVIIEKYNQAAQFFISGYYSPITRKAILEAYEAAQDTTTMTGATEK